MTKTIIFDLDGTLALIDHRRHLVEKPSYNDIEAKGLKKFGITGDPWHSPYYSEFINYLKVNYHAWTPDWDAFFEACDKDLPNHPIITINQMIRISNKYNVSNLAIKIYSGRSVKVMDKTKAWLKNYDVRYDYLRMRPENDFTPDEQLKLRWLNQDFQNPKDEVLMVFDDRQKVVDMWRAQGLTCVQVAPGNF